LNKFFSLLIFFLHLATCGWAQVSANLSSSTPKAGDTICIKGKIPPGEELNIVIASEVTFSPQKALGPQEKSRLIKDGEKFGFRPDTSIPYLFYIITSDPFAFGEIIDKSYGGAFFFKGLYKTKMFKLKDWDDIPISKKKILGPIKTKEQWNFLRYSHENPFGINTIGKEGTYKGRIIIFSRCVVTDYQKEPRYWNKGVSISLNKHNGKFSVTFKTFRHTPPYTKFNLYLNGKATGSFVVEPNGLWLPRGWRYINPILILIGAILAGTFYSMVGASGGLLMAAFQIIFIGTAGPLGINGANVLKPSNLPLMFGAPSAALYRYWFKEHRLALPAGTAFAVGILIGAFIIGPPLSTKYLNMTAYKPWLALLVLIMALRTLYELTPHSMKKRESIKRIIEKFNEEVRKAQKENRAVRLGRGETIKFSLLDYRFKFWGEEFRINTVLFALLGIFIGIIDSSFGIGGGFLLVPTMTILGKLPMYVAVPISLFSSILGCTAGLSRYILMGYPPDLYIAFFILIGGLIGGMLGSKIHGFLSERQLKIILAIVLLFLVFRFAEIEIWI